MLYEDFSHSNLDAGMSLHSGLDPGPFEELYKVCLRHKLTKAGIKELTEVDPPVTADGVTLDIGYRIHLMVENKIILELKSVLQYPFPPPHGVGLPR